MAGAASEFEPRKTRTWLLGRKTIGANTPLLSIFNSLLWKPLPVEEPERLVRIDPKRAVPADTVRPTGTLSTA